MGFTEREEIGAKQKLVGWALSAGIVYVIQALVWATVWSIFTLGPDNEASTHWILKMIGGFFFGLMIGLIPAGLIFLAAYSIPGVILWATINRSACRWRKGPVLSCLIGAILGIAAVGLLVGIGQPSNALNHWLSVLILGGVYGVVTALACRFVARKILGESFALARVLH